MKTNLTRRRLATASVLLLGGALSGCVVVPLGRHHGSDGAYETVVIDPPVPPYEVVGRAPGRGYFWIGGHWRWSGARHHWIPGRWEAHRPGYRWAPHRWHRHGQGWREIPGHWRR